MLLIDDLANFTKVPDLVFYSIAIIEGYFFSFKKTVHDEEDDIPTIPIINDSTDNDDDYYPRRYRRTRTH